nr:MAG TPA: secretion system protein [Bacteriophage sp.]
MSRTLNAIYKEAVAERNKRLELTEFSSDSKLSILNGITWVVATVIYSFETILDVFAYDISETINKRINGTPDYYARALLQYQKGDELTVREDGLAFGYASVDESKQIITQVSYEESTDDVNLDSKLVLKVATGDKGNLSAIPADELVQIRTYLNRIKFAGTRIEVTSLPGDVLVPRLSVYWDGAISEAEVYDNIEASLNEYMMNIDFNAGIYVSKVIAAIRSAEHVTDVWIDEEATPAQGVFLACYDADGVLKPLQKVARVQNTTSGYLRQSSGKAQEEGLPNFREALKLIVDE